MSLFKNYLKNRVRQIFNLKATQFISHHDIKPSQERMKKLVYAKYNTYELQGRGDLAVEYIEAIESDEKDKDLIIRHVMIGPTQKVWCDAINRRNDEMYMYMEHPFFSEWVSNKDGTITAQEFEAAWKEAGGPKYNLEEIWYLTAVVESRD